MSPSTYDNFKKITLNSVRAIVFLLNSLKEGDFAQCINYHVMRVPISRSGKLWHPGAKLPSQGIAY
jgi:hypothetical protein